MRKPWKVMTTIAVASSLLIATGCTEKKVTGTEKASEYTVPVVDYTFDTAGNMFAYAEFELSGEPLAESLGLDLDLLDPKEINKPTKFDYTAGIESYEYSEEAMYEVVEKSGLGLHLIHGPVVEKMAKEAGKNAPTFLEERFYEIADSVGYPKDEIFSNMYPTFIEYASGNPHYITKVDTSVYAENEDNTFVPVYQVDFKSLRWDREKMSKTLTPSAYGAVFLKQTLWAGDFLGGFHTVDMDEELEATSPTQDSDPNVRLGVSSADGMQGVILTEEIWNKLGFIRDGLFYDATRKSLTSGTGSSYNPSQGFVYLPHEITVTEAGSGTAAKAGSMQVTDVRSLLRDQWLILWPSSEFFGMTDQRPENKNVNPAFHAAFDGQPFAKATMENTDAVNENDVQAYDPYSLNRDVLLQVFKNIEAMHFNKELGAFISENDGTKQGEYIDTFEAGYTMEAMRIFQRAIDGLPVGYASGEDAKGLGTPEGKLALEMIRKQADFMLNKLRTKDGFVANGYVVGKGQDTKTVKLEAQLGAIRGLTAAFLATKDEKYRDAAREIYNAVDKKMWNKKAHAYETVEGKMQYTPFTAGSVSATLRLALTNLSNTEDDKTKYHALEQQTVVSRYVDFYNQVIDGPSLKEGMQVSEFWDTGDFYKKGSKLANTDNDMVPQIQAGHGKYGIAPILVNVEIKK
ncbi:hypothetical protein [Bacillus sp. 165]|uniref:hypothetical protein n=1 Tax=Bacillus sp. 165 TaxID=1529117 RepID=UPI001ADAB27B|nr:hypothetical protein [Bacillus sp. 165]MBO9128313.1 hypothetical protein [Bacillus sp. 165]